MIAGTLEIQLLANMARLQKDMQEAKASVTGVVNDMNRLLGRIGVGISFAGIAALGASAIRASEEAAQAQRKLDAVIRATGNASGYTADQLSLLADRLARVSTFDDEGFRVATATLLRFGNIGGANLEKVLKLSADYAALTGTDVVAAAEIMGKALNNPAEGLKRLERNFGDLGKETEAAIKLQQDMGNQSGALAIAIEALQKKIGGADETMNAGLTGSVKQLRKAISELMEAMGSVADNSVVTGIIDGVSASLRGLKEVIDGPWALKLAAILALMQGRGIDELMRIGNMAPGAVTPGGSGGGSTFSLSDQDARGMAYLERLLKARNDAAERANAELTKENERYRQLDNAGWVRYAETLTAEYEDELRAQAKLTEDFYASKDELRQMDLEGQEWLARNVVKITERETAERLKLEEQFQQQRAAEWNQLGSNISSGFTSMFSDLLDGRLRDWKDFSRSLGDIFKRSVVDVVGNAFRGMMNNLMSSLASGNFSLSGLLNGVNPYGLAGGGGSIAGALINGALGSGPRGQQVGTMAGGAGAMLGFYLGGPVGAVAGAVIGSLIGHFTDPDGLAQRHATFGSMNGATGPTGYSYTSPFGTFGLSDTSWFSDADMGEQLRRYFGGLAAWERSVAGYLTEDETARVTAALGTSTRYNFGEEHGDFSGTLGEMTADRARIILNAVDPVLAQLVEGFQGTGEELGQFVLSLLGMRQALADMNITGLNMETIQLMGRAGETLEQTFQRVAGTWSWFTQNFYTEAERVELATTQVNTVFGQLGIAVPGSITEFRQLVAGIDLSTEAGRALWNALLGVAPAFLTVMNAADGATDSTEALADALERQAEIQRQIEESVRNSRQQQLDQIVSARGGLRGFLQSTLLDTGLTPLDPMQRLGLAQREYESILQLSQGGDLGAVSRLGGAADTYLRIARELFASSGAYVDIFNRVTGDVGRVDARLATDEAILRATLGLAESAATQVDILRDVKTILLEIRDGTYEGVEKVASAVEGSTVALARR